MALVASAQAACEEDGAIELDIPGYGLARVGNFEADPSGGRAVLFDGVCLELTASRTTLRSEQLEVEGLDTVPILRATDVRLELPELAVDATTLRADPDTIELEGIAFRGEGIQGVARQLRFDPRSGAAELVELRIEGDGFRASGATGRFEEGVIALDQAAVTTCVCDDAPFLQIEGSSARFRVSEAELELLGALLVLGRLRFDLGDVVAFDREDLENLSVPLQLEYRGADAEPASGLGVVVPGLDLGAGLSLEAGLTGLDAAYPSGGFALIRVEREGLQAEVGLARGGPRADVSVTEALAPGLDAVFAVRNRHEPASDFLHEGSLAVQANGRLRSGGAILDADARVFAAVSHQELDAGGVSDARLGASAGTTLRAPEAPFGRLALQLEVEGTYYPAADRIQYGVRVVPSWRLRRGDIGFGLSWDRRFTNAASPFSTELDRLSPRHLLRAELDVEAALAEGWSLDLGFLAGYSLLPGDGAVEGWKDLRLRLELPYRDGLWSVLPAVELQLAALLDPRPLSGRRAYLDVDLGLRHDEVEAGLRIRGDLAADGDGLERFELRLGFPLRNTQATLQPFAAVDLAEALGGGPLALTGYGAELAVPTCCGTLALGFRHESSVSSLRFGLRIDE